MGLSDGERIKKTYWQFMRWRAALVALRDAMPDEYTHQRGVRDVVDGWIRRVDRMTGRLIAKRDSSGAYWILGPSDENYRSHFDVLDVFGAPKEEQHEYNSYEAFTSMRMTEFTRRLSEGSFESEHADRARVVAAWWSMWNHVDAILYPVYRYNDRLFPDSLHDDLWTLFGEIANRRYEIIAANADKTDVRDEILVEQAVLSKWKLFHIRLEAADPLKKLSKKKLHTYDEVRRRRPFPGFEMIDEIGNMSLAQVATELEQHEDTKFKSKNEWNRKQREEDEKKPKKIDGVLGPKTRTSEELYRIVDTSPNRDEAIAAGKELSAAHRTYADWESVVDARLNPKKKRAKKKR